MASFTPGSARVLLAGVVSILCLVLVLAIASVGTAAVAPDDSQQHGPLFGHLPPTQDEMEVVGRLEVSGQFGDVVEGQIADLSVYKGFAYLNSWDEESCTRGGTYVADMTNPAAPKEIGFIPATPGYYHGEGAHVVTLNTPQFQGDLLAVNDEACSNDATRPPSVDVSSGGFDLYDVTDPRNPKVFVRNAGDPSGDDGSLEPDPTKGFNSSYHSVFVWQDGPRAFLVGVDNIELHDVDIFDITDPANPEFIADIDLVELAANQGVDIISLGANGQNVFNHDMVVKRVGNQLRMLVSYWDAGYVQIDVSDPANPVYITDTDFDDPDPLFPDFDTPEGNAHQGEYTHDNQFFLAADEDFAPDRVTSVDIEGLGPRPASIVPGGAGSGILADGVLNGPTAYGGYGCPGSAPVPDRDSAGLPDLEPGEEAILVMQRGPEDDPSAPEESCFPGEKAQAAVDAGWDAVLLMNRHFPGGAADDVANCGSGGFTSLTVAVCTTHAAGHELFSQAPGYDLPYPDGHMPALGTLGAPIEVVPEFDGWGYAHLYDANTSEELDAFAIPEARDERFAVGFGDLSIHEVATDPATNLAYLSYYSGGIRVLRYSRAAGLEEVGAWIDDQGSNFWGIEQLTAANGERLIAGSDRDYGLVILRYTGPGAVGPTQPGAGPGPTGPPAKPSNRLRVRLGRYRNGRLTVVANVAAPGRLIAGLRANLPRVGAAKVSRLARSSRRVTRAGRVRLTLRVSRAKRRQLRRALGEVNRVGATLTLKWTPTGGTTRRVSRRLVIGRS